MFDAWGVLPIAVLLLVFTAWKLTALVLSDATRTEQAAGLSLACLVLPHFSVSVLALFGVVSRGALLTLLAAIAVLVTVLGRGRRLQLVRRLTAVEWAVALFLLSVTVLAAATARLLPIWQWDSIGYHLPFVSFVLQSGGFAEVPPDLRYISTYPHNIELAMVWLRAMLPDDRLVDLAQLPYGLLGVAFTAAIARRLGAGRELSLAAGTAWVAAPVVFLQLPTNYVDVGTATTLLAALFFLVFSPPRFRNLALGGIALGLFLGSKPSAPMATALVAAVVMVRALVARQRAGLAVFAVAVIAFGAQSYLSMLIRHGNPVWPVEVRLGPLTLAGQSSIDSLLAAGASAQRAPGFLLARITTSWLALDTWPVFDMRMGGLGWLFLFSVPLAVVALVRRRGGWLLVALAAALLSPDPSVSRYVLAFAAVTLAAAAAELAHWPKATGPVVLTVLGLCVLQLHGAWPGLTGDGPEWSAFLTMTDDERRIAVGPQGSPTDYPPAWGTVARGESVAFDESFEFPGFLWSPDLRYPVALLPEGTDEATSAWLDEKRVRLLAVGPAHQAVVEADPARWQRLFECRSSPCAVYLRRD